MKGIPSALLLSVLLLASACKKKEVAPVAGFSASQYFLPLATGNYWVYERTEQGSSGAETDSIKIASDTTINGFTYYHVTNGFYEGIDDAYYRDSSGVILEYGSPVTTYKLTNHRNDTLLTLNENNLINVVRQTGNPDTTINVTAGAFNALQVINNTYYSATYQPPAGVSSPRPSYLYFSKGIGVVFATIFFTESPNIISCQLTSYHIASK